MCVCLCYFSGTTAAVWKFVEKSNNRQLKLRYKARKFQTLLFLKQTVQYNNRSLLVVVWFSTQNTKKLVFLDYFANMENLLKKFLKKKWNRHTIQVRLYLHFDLALFFNVFNGFLISFNFYRSYPACIVNLVLLIQSSSLFLFFFMFSLLFTKWTSSDNFFESLMFLQGKITAILKIWVRFMTGRDVFRTTDSKLVFLFRKFT